MSDAPPADRSTADGGASGRPGSTFVLDRAAWAVLCERLPAALVAGVPAGFRASVDVLADRESVAAGRAATAERLRSAGLFDAQGAPSSAALALGAVLTTGRLRVQVRAWSQDRAVLRDLVAVVGPAAPRGAGPGEPADRVTGVGLTRLERVGRDPGGAPVVDGEGAGVEVCLFGSDGLLDGVWRTVAPRLRSAGRVPAEQVPTAPAGVVLPWPAGLAAASGTGAPGASATQGAAASEAAGEAARRTLLEAAGWDDVPPVVADLAAGLDAALEVSVTASPGLGDDAAAERWFGTWLAAGDRLVAVRVERGPGADPSGEVALRLHDADGRGLRSDLVRALCDALDVALGGPDGGGGGA